MSHLNINGVDKPLDHIRLNNVRSENLFESFDIIGKVPSVNDGELVYSQYGATTSYIPIYNGNIVLSANCNIGNQTNLYIFLYDVSDNLIGVKASNGSLTGNIVIYGNTISGYTDAVKARIRIDNVAGSINSIMLNLGSTALPYQPYYITKEAWEARDKSNHLLWGRADTFTGTNSISARCYGLPVKSWEIDGNSQQSGTPAPDDPIMPEFVGDRTENLFEFGAFVSSITAIRGNGIFTAQNGELSITSNELQDAYTLPFGGSIDGVYKIPLSPNTQYSVYAESSNIQCAVFENGQIGTGQIHAWNGGSTTFTTLSNTTFVTIRFGVYASFPLGTTGTVKNIMLNTGSTAKPYTPHGYKINITSAGQTVPVYLGQVQTLRRVKKLVLTGLETVYENQSGDNKFLSIANSDSKITGVENCMCSHFVAATIYTTTTTTGFLVTSNDIRFRPADVSTMSADYFKTFIQQQYAVGTPVTVWYVMSDAETAIVNEPLAKIGTYADTLTSDQAGITIPTTDGSTTISVDTALAPSKFEVKVHAKPIHFGFKIDKSVSDPSNAVIYTHDAVTMTPAGMDFTNGVFNYGSWENVWFIKNARPVMLNFDGTEAYDLDPNDYSKKLDGTPSDIADSTKNMNAMIAFPTVWIKRTDDASYNYIEISDSRLDSDFHAYAHEDANGVVKPYIYLPIYKGSMVDGKLRSISGVKPRSSTTAQQEVDAASALGTGWQIWDYTSKEMLCDLLTLISKSLDTQGKFGQGHSTGGGSESDFLDCGTLNNKGKFFGYSATTSQVKCFGMEALWGERWDRELGLILDDGIYKIKEHPAYNFTGEGYTTISASVAQSPTSNGYIKTEVSTQFGSLPTVVGGTSTTYYCDYFYQNQSGIRVALRGCHCGSGASAGLRYVLVNSTASGSYWDIGASPVYK